MTDTKWEESVLHLMQENSWSREKAEEFLRSKIVVANFEADVSRLEEILPVLQRFGLVRPTARIQVIIPNDWFLEATTAFREAFGEKFQVELPSADAKEVN